MQPFVKKCNHDQKHVKSSCNLNKGNFKAFARLIFVLKSFNIYSLSSPKLFFENITFAEKLCIKHLGKLKFIFVQKLITDTNCHHYADIFGKKVSHFFSK